MGSTSGSGGRGVKGGALEMQARPRVSWEARLSQARAGGVCWGRGHRATGLRAEGDSVWGGGGDGWVAELGKVSGPDDAANCISKHTFSFIPVIGSAILPLLKYNVPSLSWSLCCNCEPLALRLGAGRLADS